VETTAIYPGTFDPMTKGHIDLVKRACTLFDHVIVAVAINPRKHPLFSLKERVDLAQQSLVDLDNVNICGFEGLLVDLAIEKNAQCILRGLRTARDFEHEYPLAMMNRKIQPQIETLFLAADAQLSYISSSLVREIALLQGDVTDFVSPYVHQALQSKFR